MRTHTRWAILSYDSMEPLDPSTPPLPQRPSSSIPLSPRPASAGLYYRVSLNPIYWVSNCGSDGGPNDIKS